MKQFEVKKEVEIGKIANFFMTEVLFLKFLYIYIWI